MSETRQARLFELMNGLHNESLSAEEFAELEGMLVSDEQIRRMYARYNYMCVMLRKFHQSQMDGLDADSVSDDSSAFQVVIEQDLHDTAVRQAMEEAQAQQQAMEDSLTRPRRAVKPRFGRKDVLNGLLRVAAVIVVALGIIWLDRMLQRELNRQPAIVGTLTDTYQARWDVSPLAAESGNFLRAKPMRLLEGLAEITLESGSTVLVQAPCEFQLINSNKLFLETGSITAAVPEQARGFTVLTHGGEVVDYGTEFAIRSNRDGETTTGVFKGKVTFTSKTNLDKPEVLNAGQSVFRDKSGDTKRIQLNPNVFVRAIPQDKTPMTGLPGKRIDLADIIGGGNGFGSGQYGFGIDPLTGELKEAEFVDRAGEGNYVPAPSLPYVDGLFIPNGENGPIKISSAGHLFQNCPKTCNIFSNDIANIGRGGRMDRRPVPVLKGIKYGGPEHPCIFMHANLGITFDMDAIRAAMPGVDIKQFSALFGISDGAPRRDLVNAAVWILVDGELRFNLKDVKFGAAVPVQIDVYPQDRFLTLVTTDGEDPAEFHYPNGRTYISTDSDWCIFIDPVLKLEGK